MGKFRVNTHRAYLNTDVRLSCDLPDASIIDKLTGKEYQMHEQSTILKLCAGEHSLYCKELNEECIVKVEDAIKLGGSKIKNAFVFDDKPAILLSHASKLLVDFIYKLNMSTSNTAVVRDFTVELCVKFISVVKDKYDTFELDATDSKIERLCNNTILIMNYLQHEMGSKKYISTILSLS